jgi:hypothetical protein
VRSEWVRQDPVAQALDEYTFPDLCVTASAPVAVSFAKAWGRNWVDEHSL